MTTNAIAYFSAVTERLKLGETTRHNVATEAETNRHNITSENLGYATLAETMRSNRVNENIKWFNAYETARSHRANESLGWANVDLGYANLSELSTHNRATEAIQADNVDLGYAKLGETTRHDVELENVQSTQAEGALLRGQAAKQDAETRAANANSERWRNYSQAFHNYTSGAQDISSILGYWTSDQRKRSVPMDTGYYDIYGNWKGDN